MICTEADIREMFNRFRKTLADAEKWLKTQAVAA
jgi:hypothetical protein